MITASIMKELTRNLLLMKNDEEKKMKTIIPALFLQPIQGLFLSEVKQQIQCEARYPSTGYNMTL